MAMITAFTNGIAMVDLFTFGVGHDVGSDPVSL